MCDFPIEVIHKFHLACVILEFIVGQKTAVVVRVIMDKRRQMGVSASGKTYEHGSFGINMSIGVHNNALRWSWSFEHETIAKGPGDLGEKSNVTPRVAT